MSGTTTVSAGSVTATTGGTVSSGSLTLSGGDVTITAPAALNVSGAVAVSSAASVYTGTGNVTVGGNVSVSAGSFGPSGGTTTLTAGDLLVSGGTSTIGAALVLSGATGDISVAAGTATFAAAVTMTGGTVAVSGGTLTNNGAIGGAGSLAVSGSGTANGTGSITVTGNVVLDGAGTASLAGDGRTITVGGDWDETGGAVFQPASGTVIFGGTAPGVTTAGGNFFDLTVNGAATLASAIDVNGSVQIGAAGTLAAAGRQINVAGNWNRTGTGVFTPSGNTVVFDGAGSIVNNETLFSNVTVSAGARTSGAGFSAANLTVNGTGSLAATAGFNVSGTTTVSGGSIATSAAGSASTGVLTLSGGSFANGRPLTVVTGNLGISNAGSTLSGAGTVGITNGNLVVSAGAFNAGGAVTIASGNAQFSGGTSTVAGAVNLNGGASAGLQVSGGTATFAAAVTLTGGTVAVSGTGILTNNGALTGAGSLAVSGGTANGTGNVTVAGNVTIGGGTLVGTGRTINVGGDWDESGTFTSAGSGIVNFTGTAPGVTATSAFYNFRVNGTVTLASPITVAGAMQIQSGLLDVSASNHQISVALNWNRSGGSFDARSGTVVFDGAGSILNNESQFNNVTVSAGARTSGAGFSAANLTVSGTGALTTTAGFTVSGATTVSGGTLTATTGGTVSSGSLTLSGGDVTVTAPAALNVSGAVAVSSAASVYTGTGNVTVGGNVSISAGSFGPSGGTTTLTAGDLLVSGGTSTIGAALVLSGPTGDISVAAGTATFAAAVTMTGGTVAVSGGTLTNNGAIGGAGSLAVSGSGTANGTANVTVAGNVVLGGAGTASLAGDGRTITVGGDWDETGGAVFQPASGTVIFGGTAPGVTTAGGNFFDLTVNGAATLASAIDVNGSVQIGAAGTLAAAGRQINVAGNWTNGGTFDGTGTVRFDGAAAQTLNAGTSSFANLWKSGSSTLTVQTSALTVTGTLTVDTANVIDVADRNFTIGTLSNDGTLRLDGTAAQTQSVTTMDVDSGLVLYAGLTGGIVKIGSFYDLEIAGGGTFSLDAAKTVARDLSITSGTLSAGPWKLTVGRNWSNTGVFNAGTGEVEFTGTGTISITGSNAWYDFTCTVQGARIEFADGSTQSVLANGTFLVHGGPADPPDWITLTNQSDPAANYWSFNLDQNATLDLLYVHVRFSDATTNPISVPPDVDTFDCPGWIALLMVSQTETRDSDGNGKIDRIWVLLPVDTNEDYSDIMIRVEGYDIDTGVGTRGLQTANEDPALNYDEFYINLVEKPVSTRMRCRGGGSIRSSTRCRTA